jgi:hypothetical protein
VTAAEAHVRGAGIAAPGGRDLVAIILAIGLAMSLLTIVAAVMYDAVRSDTPGLSENATQILTGWGGGVVGVLGSYLGFRAGEARRPPPSGDGD